MLVLRSLIIASLCGVVPISAKKQHNKQKGNNAPLDCVLNEKRPNHGNPFTFYFCGADGPTLVECPDIMIFDSIAKKCVRQAMPLNNVTITKLPIDTGGRAPQPGGWPASTGGSPPPAGWSAQPAAAPANGWSVPTNAGPSSGWSVPTTTGPTTTTTTTPATTAVPPTAKTPATTAGPPTTTTTTTTPAPPTVPSSIQCPQTQDEKSKSVYFPKPNDCTKFYQCANGVPVEMSCPFGLYFNPKLNVCDRPSNVPGCP